MYDKSLIIQNIIILHGLLYIYIYIYIYIYMCVCVCVCVCMYVCNNVEEKSKKFSISNITKL